MNSPLATSWVPPLAACLYAALELFQGQIRWTHGGCMKSEGHPVHTSQELQEWVLSGICNIPFYMSRKCEKLLKKFLILKPSKRGTSEPIRKDVWMNTGHEDEIKPYVGPTPTTRNPGQLS